MPRQKPPKPVSRHPSCIFGYDHTGTTDDDFWCKISRSKEAVLCEFDSQTHSPSYWLTLEADICDIYVLAYEKWVNWLELEQVSICPGRKRVDYVVVGEDWQSGDPPVIMVIEICESLYLRGNQSDYVENQSHDFQQVKYTTENACQHSDDPIGTRIHVEAHPHLLYLASFAELLGRHRTIGVVFPVLQTNVRQERLPIRDVRETPIYLLSFLQTTGRQNPEVRWSELLERMPKD
jgi:hypothetical protein